MYFIILLLFILVPFFLFHYLKTLLRYHRTTEVLKDSTQTPSSSPSSFELKLDNQELVPKISTNEELVPPSFSSTFLEEEHQEASSSRPSFSWNYDVFLSFRGEDIRNNFTDHLYSALCHKGVDTFSDAEELQKGHSIAPELRKAIEESQLAVIILSPNYASPTWCSDELAYVLECKKVTGMKVLPIVYHVEPSEVRKQTGIFGEALAKHEKSFIDDMCKVEKWRQALMEIADVSGWNVNNYCWKESEVIVDITRRILNILNHRSSPPNRILTGMDALVEIVVPYLVLGSDKILTIGMWGMGGIGKTTLAKEVYRKIHDQFHTSGFICNVRLHSEVELQKLVCESFSGDGCGATVKKGSIRTRLFKKKVLLVLDDVDELKQITSLVPAASAGMENFWGPGSRLVITTRDRRTLTELGVLEDKIYEVEKLNDEEANQLLCQKAFKKVNPPKEFVELSKSFLKYACGLPLALEVLGSHLSGRTTDEWSEVLDRLDEHLDKDIFSVLQISFDGLHTTDKIFLDIACFFNGENDARVKKILNGCGFSSRIGISNLVNKSLVRIERGKLCMHDLLRYLGWHIVRRESVLPGHRSRLWLDDNTHKYEMRRSWRVEDAHNVLTENTGTMAVESLFLSLPEKEEICLYSDPFLTMSKLRLLKISNVTFVDVLLSYSSKHLRRLEWHGCPLESLTSWFTSELRLVELKIPNSHIERLWDVPERLWDVPLFQLKTLIHMDLSNCRYLARTLDLSVTPNLETLNLEGCTELSEIYSINFLWHLVLLNLKGCVSLTTCRLISRSLRTLVLSGCTNLRELPDMGGVETLSELYLDGTAIEQLPPAYEHLKGLILLNLSSCNNLQRIPSEVFGITSLRFLYLVSCSRMETLPASIGYLKHLEELDVCETAIREVPQSIRFLKNLKLLCFHGCSELRMLCFLPGLISLTTLNLGGCNLADWDISDGIGSLSSLQSLDLSENNFSSIPESICQLPKLKEISLCGCVNLKSLPGDPPASAQNVDIRGCIMLTNCSDKWRNLASQDGLRIRNCQKWDDRRPFMSFSVQFDEFHETPYP